MNAETKRQRVCHGRCSLKNLSGSESRIAGAFSSAFICVYLRPSLFLRPLTAVSEVTESSIQPQLEARLVPGFRYFWQGRPFILKGVMPLLKQAGWQPQIAEGSWIV